jgi:hypothetical protein
MLSPPPPPKYLVICHTKLIQRVFYFHTFKSFLEILNHIYIITNKIYSWFTNYILNDKKKNPKSFQPPLGFAYKSEQPLIF